MISINVPNALTIAAVAVLTFAGVKWLGSMLGISTAWL